MAEQLEGTVFGRYRVERLLGSGGMGAVYAGVQEPLGRPVAIKVLRSEISENADVVARFKREAELAASLSHPNIAQVTDFGIERGRAFLVMDLLEGESLAQLLAREGRLSQARVQRIAMQVLTALAVAHERGVVHRDLKPENIFVQKLAGMELVKLLDFGIARLVDGDHTMTNTGAVLGTPAYMSPEQARGKRVDARSDVFSIGGVLYEMLSGERPFVAENYHELMFKVVEERPKALTEIDPDMSPELAAIVERAMSKSTEARYASATEMRDAVGALTGLHDAPPRGAKTGPLHGGPIPATRGKSEDAFAATMASEPNAPRVETPPAKMTPVELSPTSPSAPKSRTWVAVPLGLLAAALLLIGGFALGHQPVAAPPPAQPSIVIAAPTSPPAPPPMRPMSADPPAPPVAPVVVEPVAPPVVAPPVVEPAADPPPTTHPRLAAWVTARCGEGASDEVELPRVGPRDFVSVSSAQTLEGAPPRRVSELRRAVHDQASSALTTCYRGQPILQGQDFTLYAEADGTVSRVEPRIYCPLTPAIIACTTRALRGVVFPDPPGTPFSIRVGVSIQR